MLSNGLIFMTDTASQDRAIPFGCLLTSRVNGGKPDPLNDHATNFTPTAICLMTAARKVTKAKAELVMKWGVLSRLA